MAIQSDTLTLPHNGAAPTRPPQVEVHNLSVEYPGGVQALRNVSLQIHLGELVGLVGESGSGKSTLGGALVGDLPGAGRITEGNIRLFGPGGSPEGAVDLATASAAERQQLWGRRVSMVYQDPFAALNPSLTIGNQIDEAVRRRPDLIQSSVRARTLDLLEQVHMPAPAQIARRYPHQLSGGQQQRAVIAMALAAAPDLLILDEPTTGLDVTTEAHILDLVRELRASVNAAIIFITHDLAVIAQIADRVGVLYAGELFEVGTVQEIFHQPSAPYTAGLLACIPRIHTGQATKPRLRTIPGYVPPPGARPSGCTFVTRCPFARSRCEAEHPELYATAEEGHLARCFYIDEVRTQGWPALDSPAPDPAQLTAAQPRPSNGSNHAASEPLLTGQNIAKSYGQNVRKYWIAGPVTRRPVVAIKDISFTLQPGETLGVVGESGCGKTTLVNCISGLVPASEGTLLLEGKTLPRNVAARPRPVLRRIQMVFQNPDLSLNPRQTVGAIMDRAVQLLGDQNSADARRQHVVQLMQQVGLGEHYLARNPAELSGGEKQRVAVARALAGNPDVVLADEITSALDVSVRASILNLLNDLQSQQGIAYIFISHDMSAIRNVSDRVMVLYLGMVMEVGAVRKVFTPPFHPYTEALVSAIPTPDPNIKGTPIRLEGAVPSASRRPTGCPFHTRCPRKVGPICEQETPPWRQAEGEHYIYCHIPIDELTAVQAPHSSGAG
jgi:peptide/nickel transport system ATP-binding protein